eukprot:TRINITY_DN11311_c0_g1_i1.p2 TRINITY_DN11311_c0_g1~~TRINITY_DN11311_c0_g1_i1.p2  ORF type:complete len:127 (+),score=25.40 TRINITY_DN11311_c0_g1_i1:63-443(+)
MCIRDRYQFCKGQAPKSFGILVGKLAGLPEEVIHVAKKKSCLMIKESHVLSIFTETQEKFVQLIKEIENVQDSNNSNLGTPANKMAFSDDKYSIAKTNDTTSVKNESDYKCQLKTRFTNVNNEIDI